MRLTQAASLASPGGRSGTFQREVVETSVGNAQVLAEFAQATAPCAFVVRTAGVACEVQGAA